MIDRLKQRFMLYVVALTFVIGCVGGCEYADRKDDELAAEQRGNVTTTTDRTDASGSRDAGAVDDASHDDGPLLISDTGEAASPRRETSGSDSAVTRVVDDSASATKKTATEVKRELLPPIADGPLRTVPSIDIHKYTGKWYEIARYDSTFQRGIVGVVAHYDLDGDIIRVRNTGFEDTLSGDPTDSTAKAWVVEGTKNTQWKVQFIWPLKAEYWVIDLGDDYEYAVVGQPKRGYLWILSRTPTLAPDVLDGILRRLCKNGYDPAKLSYTPQPKDGKVFEVGGADKG